MKFVSFKTYKNKARKKKSGALVKLDALIRLMDSWELYASHFKL